jgi:uncharacterized protein (TIGR00369 family)
MPPQVPADPRYAEQIAASYARQTVLQLIGAELTEVAPGAVTISLPFRADLCQHHGFLHAGVVTTIVDTACGYAALILAPPGSEVLSVEFKINFLAPAQGARLIARGTVKKAGRTVSVCTGDVVALDTAGREKPVATMLATMMLVRERRDLTPPQEASEPGA